MADNLETELAVRPEQVRYAGILEKGMYLGLGILLFTFAIYALGIIKPYIPTDEISRYWGLNVHDYLLQTDIKNGWGWLGMLRYGDFINFIGIAILAGVTIICYLAIVPVLFKNNDRIYAVLALLEAVILSLAASGILAVGH
ncbi:MAG: DUF1634 domain-containing protein [Deltaproteobacteria bacterium]|nr:DUF1634 domain-containing protein [Deltaproteobacteria bacterium]MBW2085810.1 DUF1634 domain-containing protein [Deltaproteobacteria bacterium]